MQTIWESIKILGYTMLQIIKLQPGIAITTAIYIILKKGFRLSRNVADAISEFIGLFF